VINYPNNVKLIAKTLADAGHKAYAVGGCIRDSIMGKTPSDWDMTTSARPEEMMEIFERAKLRTIPTGLKHGTITVLMDGEMYECTSFRIDGSYTDSRHPDSVTFTTDVAKDLERRDFTVNAMAGDPLRDDGTVDLFCGKEDIANKIIRCVGDAKTRFSEDALRILRAIRFATVLDFDLEENTKKAAAELCPRLSDVSVERRIVELKKMLLSPNADRGIDLLFDVGAQKYIHPQIKKPCVALSTLPSSFTCRFAALFGTQGAPDLGALKLSRMEEKEIKLLCSADNYRADVTPHNARYMLSVCGDLADAAALLRANSALADMIRKEKQNDPCVSISALAVSGNDLIAVGIPPLLIGSIMKGLLEQVIASPDINTRDALISLALTRYNHNKQEKNNV